MNTLEQRLSHKLQERIQNGNLRTLVGDTNLVDFCSNDYLGLSGNVFLQQNIEKELQILPKMGLGATGSRLISGTNDYVLALEKQLAGFFEAESCLIFNSGYQVNSAILSTIPQKNDTILTDERIHASLREGARLSFAKNNYFKHNDLEDLERQLQANTIGEVFVVIETVYSMDGNFGDIAGINELCKKYNAHLIVDEAHSTGIFGKKGQGYLHEKNLHLDIFARIYTFGKAIGSHGACVVGSKILTNYLTNFARAFIYTTALPLHNLVNIKCAFEFIANNSFVINDLNEKITLFRRLFSEKNFQSIVLKESHTPIQIVQIGGNETTKKIARHIQNKGFDVRPILSPTVKEGEEILRICLHYFNTDTQITDLVEGLYEATHETATSI